MLLMKMRINLNKAVFIGCAVLLFGCSKPEERSGQPLVFVSIPPQAGILKAFAGDDLDVRTLVGEGQSPHAYEPTARQLAALGEAEILFTIGVPFETALLKKIRPLYPDLKIVPTDTGMVKRHMNAEHAHDHAEEHDHADHAEEHDHAAACEACGGHEGDDPHVWLHAGNAAVMAQNMFQALQESGAGDADKLQALQQSLRTLDEETAARLAPFKGRRFYVFHPSFGYFADAYGLEQIAIELDGKSPSPRQLADLVESARADGVKVVFVQKQFPTESARAVADAIGGTAAPLDPLAEDVMASLNQIAEAIASSYE